MFNIDSYFSVCLGLQAKTLKVDHKALRGQVLVIVFFMLLLSKAISAVVIERQFSSFTFNSP
jgi:hypothetical protein